MNEIDDGIEKCPVCGQNQNISTPPHRLIPHTVLNGRYVVGAAKGEGGFGITYIGKDTRLDRTVAIKEYFPSGLVNRNSSVSSEITETQDENGKDAFLKGRDRFLTEAKLLAKFSGEMGIVHILDFFVENNTAYIVMEYLDGMSLSNKLKADGTMSVQQTITVLMPVMLSLEKVHKQGLIHRDISPSNIMILHNTVKLIDFGAARQASRDGGKSLSLMLKPGYAPEEQYRSKGVQGPWTDVYALCATMYKCITGVTPEESNDRLHKDDLKTPSQLGINIEPGFEAALMKGLSVLQENRYQSIEALLRDISPFAVSSNAENDNNEQSKAFVAQEDQSTRFAAEQPDAQREPVFNDAYRQPVQPQWNAPPQAPVTASAQPQWNAPPQAPVTAPVQPQMQMPQQPQYQPQTQENEMEQKIAQRVKQRKKKKALVFFISLLVIASVALIGWLIYAISKGGNNNPRGETLESMSFDPTDSNLNFYISNDYVSFKKTVVTPKDISQLKSRPSIEYIHFTECEIPQETIDVLWETSEDLNSVEIEKCKGFDDLKPISKITALRSFTINQCDLENKAFKDLDFSEQTALSSVKLIGIPNLSDISCLKTAKTASHIEVSYCDVSDFSPVMELEKVYGVKIENCKVTDISPIKDTKAKYLSTISFSGNQIKDLSALKDNTRLNDIDLSSNEITSLDALADCTELRTLNLNHNKLSSLSGLEKLIRLTKVECSHNEISSLDGIKNCTVLEYVNISSNKISDISLLSKSAAKLKTVILDENEVSDLSALSGATQMKAITFNKNKITDLSAIKDLTNLTVISGDNNKIASIEPLSRMTKLTTISFAHNSITDMKPIQTLTASSNETVNVLDLSYNQIKSIEVTSNRSYEGAFFFNNPITSLDNVKNIKGMNVAVSYFDGMDVKELSNGYFRLTIVDCPLDKRMAIENEVGRYRVTFCTAEEKEKDINEKKDYVFSRLNS